MHIENGDDTRWHHDSDGEDELRPRPALLLAMYSAAAIVAIITTVAMIAAEIRLLDWFFP